MCEGETTLKPPVRHIVVEQWVAEVLTEWRAKERTGPLTLHHLHGHIETIEEHKRTQRPERRTE